MATYFVHHYIDARLVRFGIELSAVEKQAMQIAYIPELSIYDEINSDNVKLADKLCLIPLRDLLLMPDISEGGYSSKLDKIAVEKWFNAEVNRLGLGGDPIYNLTPKVRDASNRW